MAFPWFRFYHEFATDPKILSMPEVMRLRLVMLFCVRCREGCVPFEAEELCFALAIPSLQELEETKILFIKKGFINESWCVLNWDSRQFTSDSSADRTRRYRERIKNETSQNGHGSGFPSVSLGNTSNIPSNPRDTDRDKSRDGHSEVTSKKFIKPTIEEISAYCLERKNNVNPQKWLNHYESNGWMVGKNKMKDWKAAVRTWENSNFENKPKIGLVRNDKEKDYSIPEEYKNGGTW